jgi:pyruvate kinase
VGAAAIVTPTRSGATARHVSRLRPKIPILALSKVPATLGHLLLSWGVVTATEQPKADLAAVVAMAARTLVDMGMARPGDPFVLTAGFPAGTADSNLLTVQHVPAPAPRVRARTPRRAARGSQR